MTLNQAIIDYARTILTPTNDWFSWKINPNLIPDGIALPHGNPYSQNVALKLALNVQYHLGNVDTKILVTKYYIATWGGVRRNSEEKIRNYSLAPPDTLVANGIDGIASWSKALCIRDPNEHAIYDARVAVSLNCLQIIFGVDDPQLFPLLAGQNKLINKGSQRIRQFACDKKWSKAQEAEFYQIYNSMLSSAATALAVGTYAIEMLLFAHAPILLREAFPAEQL